MGERLREGRHCITKFAIEGGCPHIQIGRAALPWEIALRQIPELFPIETLFEWPLGPLWLHSFGTGLQLLYFETGETDALETAILRLKDAVIAALHHDPFFANRLHALGLPIAANLELAFQHHQRAVEATDPDDAEWTNRLFDLGGLHFTRYKRLKAIAGLEAAFEEFNKRIAGYGKCVDLDGVPGDHKGQGELLDSLGDIHYLKYDLKSSTGMIDMNISFQQFQEALDETPNDLPERAEHLYSLYKATI
ncbi:unnamed protein product [Clonostachys rosea]|uniref:Aminoglycoside phosphotransferase domain-containing protein n=1 Tax=Bionectria ochroleuca TaxID=29856 RepID=A0ABY6UYL1_BIOOC|nr:unnamed protein product [Clonostachys rosea]